ncbi:MAG: primosomal protein N' [Lachnospiraceae bacterium]|nr:primosomal protein N' [Lachnospiraceae bacterium]
MTRELYADIVVDISSSQLDRAFSYRVPEELTDQIEPGCVVRVPFGNGSRVITGYVTGFRSRPELDPAKIKDILEIVTEGLGEESRLVRLAAWIRQTYGCTMSQALRTVIPIRKKIAPKEYQVLELTAEPEQARTALEQFRRKSQKARARLLEALMDEPVLPQALVCQKLHIATAVIRSLEKMGLLRTYSQVSYRNPVHVRREEAFRPVLSEQQQHIVDTVIGEWDIPADQLAYEGCYLIRGVTGSGKTEVYMALIEHALRQGQQAIVLIPEISLTYQTVLRFCRRFGDQVSLINSRLTPGEKSDQFERARKGEISVMVGPRSALFTPFPNLGIIVMDEEQERAYASESTPRYHARETARERARLEGARLVLGSATPSMEAYFGAQTGAYRLFEMDRRAGGAAMARTQVVDLREELKAGHRGMLSRALIEKMNGCLERGEQAMLFLNRRGLAGFVSCRSCGKPVKCPHCDVSLSLHRGGQMVCHYCGYRTPQVTTCSACGSGFIRSFRAGTQQVEDEVARLFPGVRVLRMDADTTSRKDGHEKILEAFASHEAEVLIGTQMIVKGHDFPDVTLMGILAADLSLNTPDYRAAERTFQLLTQAAGRAGRGDKPGEVVIQAYEPEHYSIECAARQDFGAFYEQERLFRRLAKYPPFGSMCAVHVSGPDETLTDLACGYLKEMAQRAAGGSELLVLGPAPETIARIQDQYRRVLYLKHDRAETVQAVRRKLENYIEINEGFKSLQIQFEVM